VARSQVVVSQHATEQPTMCRHVVALPPSVAGMVGIRTKISSSPGAAGAGLLPCGASAGLSVRWDPVSVLLVPRWEQSGRFHFKYDRYSFEKKE